MLKQILNKGISTPIAIGIILILVIIVGGFTWWQYGKIRKEEANVPEVQIPEKKSESECQQYLEDNCPGDCIVCPPCEACSSLGCHSAELCKKMGFDKNWYENIKIQRETADWQTYRNEEYGFEVKYPPEATLKDWTEAYDKISINFPSDNNFGLNIFYQKDKWYVPGIRVRTFNGKYSCDIKDSPESVEEAKGSPLDCLCWLYGLKEQKIVNMGNLNFCLNELITPGGHSGETVTYLWYSIKRGEEYLVLEFRTNDSLPSQTQREQINQTLSTFKFIEEESKNCGLTNTVFQSVNQYEIGLGPTGTVLGYWSIAFKEDTFDWGHSDVAEAGNYSCKNGILEIENIDQSITASYDRNKEILIWDGIEYKKIK